MTRTSAAMINAMPTFASADFMLMRTPLLSSDEFHTWGEHAALVLNGRPQTSGRTAAHEDLPVLLESLRERIKRPLVREALLIAAPDFSLRLDAWMIDPHCKDAEKIALTAAKYYARMCCRPTPYGLFAGTWTASATMSTNLSLSSRTRFVRSCRIDFGALFDIVKDVAQRPLVRERLRYVVNSSAYRLGDRLHYAERHEDPKTLSFTYALSSVIHDDALACVVNAAVDGATLGALADILAARGADGPEARNYLIELVANQVLVPLLEPTITGGEGLATLIAAIREADPADATADRLQELSRQLRAMNAMAPGEGLESTTAVYRQIADLLRTPSDGRSRDLLDVQLRMCADTAHVGRNVLVAIENAVGVLARLASLRSASGQAGMRADIARFVTQFNEHYNEGEWVALTDLLDDENGIGFGGIWTLARPSRANTPTLSRSTALDDWQHTLSRLVVDALATDTNVIGLDVDNLPSAPPSSVAPPSASVTAFVSILSADRTSIDSGDFTVVFHECGGTSSVATFGRFCDGDPHLTAHVRRQLEREAAEQPDVVCAEIVHLPKGRAANVLARPVLRQYEIPYLGASGAAADRQLLLADLFVSVVRGEVILWSQRLNRRVMPKMTTAHAAFLPEQLPIYRFLNALDFQQKCTVFTWDWGVLATLPRLPRVVAGQAVLARARWLLSGQDLAPLKTGTTTDIYSWIADLRQRLRLPRLVTLYEGDNELPVDFDNAVTIEYLVQKLRQVDRAVLLEGLPEISLSCVDGPGGTYAHEMLVPLRQVSSGLSHQTVRAPDRLPSPRQTFPPGSEWLYVKLYSGLVTADRLLLDIIAPLVHQCADKSRFRSWFFIRYADPEPHLRFRVKGSPEALLGELLPMLHRLAAPLLNNGVLSALQIDTYVPESARYGGARGIELAERLFHLDSEAALAILLRLPDGSDEEKRRLIGMQSVDRLLDAFDLSLDRKLAFVEPLQESFARLVYGPFADALSTRRALAAHFRAQRTHISTALTAPYDEALPLHFTNVPLQARGIVVKEIAAALRDAEAAGILSRPVDDLLSAYTHMSLNRLMRNDHTRQEFLVYDGLLQSYRSQRGRTAGRSGSPSTDRDALPDAFAAAPLIRRGAVTNLG